MPKELVYKWFKYKHLCNIDYFKKYVYPKCINPKLEISKQKWL